MSLSADSLEYLPEAHSVQTSATKLSTDSGPSSSWSMSMKHATLGSDACILHVRATYLSA